ncbi:MAG TPA: sulfatase-like hydrolase/transferase, partial [bacterium]|nr:sulfatase-like hydrolase/transferase [bacterium]
NSKWGVHDHVLLARLADTLRTARAPWFTTVFTLSSHEPYDAPGPVVYPGTDEADRFRNAMRYTDRAVGDLLGRLRADRRLWDSTLVVLVADHGHPLPDWTTEHDPDSYRIPLLLTGGALKAEWRGRRGEQICSQTDLLATLLGQLGQPTQDLAWSRNLLVPMAEPFAFFVFNDGFGLVKKAGVVTFDNVGRRVIRRDRGVGDAQLRQGQALMQETFGEFLRY